MFLSPHIVFFHSISGCIAQQRFYLFAVAQLRHGIRAVKIYWGIFVLVEFSIWRTPWLRVSVPACRFSLFVVIVISPHLFFYSSLLYSFQSIFCSLYQSLVPYLFYVAFLWLFLYCCVLHIVHFSENFMASEQEIHISTNQISYVLANHPSGKAVDLALKITTSPLNENNFILWAKEDIWVMNGESEIQKHVKDEDK